MIQTYRQDRIALTQKGQKIIAALFLVTGHLPDADPMREKLRSLAVGLMDCTQTELSAYCNAIIALLESCRYAGLVSEGNTQIIIAEIKYFADPLYRNDTLVSGLFPTAAAAPALDKGHVSDKKTGITDMSFTLKPSNTNVPDRKTIHTELQKEKKDRRQEKIVSYITTRKSASIKDIAVLFPDVSEKTIQRELNVLVAAGKINRRGNKRWSLYLAL